MHNTLLMRRFDRLSDLTGDAECLVQGKSTLLDPTGQRRSFHEIHHEVIRPHIVQLTDVGMVERSNHPRFPFEPLTRACG